MSTWFCLASGPSMTKEDAEAVRGRGRIIAINNTIELAPFADILYSCDPSWWWHHKESLRWFCGERISRYHPNGRPPEGVYEHPAEDVQGLGREGLGNGHNSGFQSINLAYLEGAKTIVLIGFDMSHAPDGKRHWHPDHPHPLGNFGLPELCQKHFPTLAADLSAEGVRVINASRRTALNCFERLPLDEALKQI